MQKRRLITSRVRDLFVQYGVKRSMGPRELLVEKGNRADRVFFLTKGNVRTFCLSPSGDEISLFYLGPDSLIGNEALMMSPHVMVSVATISRAEVYILPPERFLRLWKEQDLPLQDLIAHYVQRIALLSDYICCSHFQDADKRVAYFLYACCDSTGPVIGYTHEQIAAITGVSRVSVSRILGKLRKEGIISQNYRRIEVLDPQGLTGVFSSLGYFLD